MKKSAGDPEETLGRRIKWLVFFRFLFALLLLGSTIAYQLGNQLFSWTMPLLLLYGVVVSIVFLSALYGIALYRYTRHLSLFAYLQVLLDCFSITIIVFVTGGFTSVFSFLYLVVIIYAGMLLYKPGSHMAAAFCSVLFAVLLILQFNGTINPFGPDGLVIGYPFTLTQAIQKIAVMTAACFSVAVLSGYLSDQERKSKAELIAMEAHLGRVQNLAQIGEMAAGLAHEIKNPLASISGAIQILKGEMKRHDDNLRLMQIILRETDRLSGLVNNFLIFARPSAGQKEWVDLGEALNEIVVLFEKDGSISRRVDIQIDIFSNAYINIDPLQLRQVIWNLLLNGAEAIDGTGNIHIHMKKIKNDCIAVEISDDGCGMSEETIATIFNPFFTTKPNGTGLGLSIVFRILETYNYRIDVQSSPDIGSMFTVYFNQMSGPRK
jgi:two-component system sensor histidine kinase PilS (NtrC family)